VFGFPSVGENTVRGAPPKPPPPMFDPQGGLLAWKKAALGL